MRLQRQQYRVQSVFFLAFTVLQQWHLLNTIEPLDGCI